MIPTDISTCDQIAPGVAVPERFSYHWAEERWLMESLQVGSVDEAFPT